MNYEQVQALDQRYVLPVYRRQPGLFVRGEGAYLYDEQGRRYLDFLAGIAVNALGHCHPRMVEAIERQARTLIHTSNGLLTEPQARLAEKLFQITGLERVFFANCGATAMETALKIAKKYAREHGKTEFVSLQRSFHGRTLGALSATGQPKYQDPFRPLLPDFHHVPANDIEALRASVGPGTAAVLLEPIQGEGGLTVLTDEFLRAARELTQAHGALLIVDEVQTGIARTGRWLAVHHVEGLRPDLVCLAKALGGGVPIGACLVAESLASVIAPTEHGTTYGGNAFVCAVALEVLKTIEEERLAANALERGQQLAEGLCQLPHVVEVRGKGLMRGAVLDEPVARTVVRQALDEGLIINATDDHTLRFVPPLTLTPEQVDDALTILERVLEPILS